jgi:hypothetical protein
VAVSLAAVDAGVRQVQGTLNGLGERCGNANLTSLIPTLVLKEPYAGRFETGVSRARSAADQGEPDARRPAQPGAEPGRSLRRGIGLHPQGGAARERDPEGPGDLRARRAGAGGQRAVHPDVEPGGAVEPARAARDGGDRGRGGGRAARRDPRRGEGAGGPGLCLRRGGGVVRAAGAGHAGGAAAVLRGRALPGDDRAADEREGRDGHGLRGGGGGADRQRAGDEREREPGPGDPCRPGPGERALPGAGEGSRALPALHRRDAAGRLPGADHLARDRGRDAGADRQRGRGGAAVVDGRGLGQHRRRELPGAERRGGVEAAADGAPVAEAA